MSEIIEVKQKSTFDHGRIRPKIIPWHGEKMIRTHSFRAAVKEIVNASKKRDVITISLIGDPHTGKSELARALAHSIHTMSDIPYAVRIFTRDDLLDFKNTVQSLEPVNHILIFDDLSFLKATHSSKKIEQVKQEFTEIRHFENRKDVKVIGIYNFHYSPGFDKYLRQTNFKFWTSIGESEYDFVLKILGNKFKPMIDRFRQWTDDCISKGEWHIRLNEKETFTYRYQDPWIPTIFARGTQPRPVVTPTRRWIQGKEVCTKCESAEGNFHVEVDFDDVIRQGEKANGKGSFVTAIKLVGLFEGKNTLSKSVTNSVKWVQRAMKESNLPIDRFLTHYGLDITKTRLRKEPYQKPIPDQASS